MDIPTYCISVAGSSGGLGGQTLGATSFPTVLGGNWYGLIWMGLLFSIMLMAVIYMVSQVLRIPKLEAWARFELFQIGGTALLAILIAGWVWGMCNWNVAILDPVRYDTHTGEGQAIMANCGTHLGIASVSGASVGAGGTFVANDSVVTPYCAAQAFLQRVKTRGDDVFQALLGLNYGFTYLLRLSWESRPLGIGYTIEPLAGFQQLQNTFLVTISGFMVAYLSLLIQMRLLDYFLIAMPYFFIPLGLLLRCFAPTREFGGSVVGIAIATFLFFPLTLVMNDVLIYSDFGHGTGPFESGTQMAATINGQMYGTAALQASCNDTTPPTNLKAVQEGGQLQLPYGCGGPYIVKQIVYQSSGQLVFDTPQTNAKGAKISYNILRTGAKNERLEVYQIIRAFDSEMAQQELDNMASGFESQPYGNSTFWMTSAPDKALDGYKNGKPIVLGNTVRTIQFVLDQGKRRLLFLDSGDNMIQIVQNLSDPNLKWNVYTIRYTGTATGQTLGSVDWANLKVGQNISTSLGTLVVGRILKEYNSVSGLTVVLTPEGKTYIFKANGGTADIYPSAGAWPQRLDALVRMGDYFATPQPGSPMSGVGALIGYIPEKLMNFFGAMISFWVIYAFAAVMLPIINFIIFVEVARAASIFLGAEMDLTNLTRLI